jgi:hypothetical protein
MEHPPMTKRDVSKHFGHLEVDDELMVVVKNQINRICRKMLTECFLDFSKGNWYPQWRNKFFWLPDDGGILQDFAPINIEFGPDDLEKSIMWRVNKDLINDRGTIHPDDAGSLLSFLSGFKKAIERIEKQMAKIPRVPED